MEASDQLHRDLDAITQAILTGDLARLSELTRALEQTLTRPGALAGSNALTALQAKVDRNATLLRAAQRGLRSAQRRLAEIRGVSRGLSTYDADGHRAFKAGPGLADHRV